MKNLFLSLVFILSLGLSYNVSAQTGSKKPEKEKIENVKEGKNCCKKEGKSKTDYKKCKNKKGIQCCKKAKAKKSASIKKE